ncbi:MAG: hypothetical protein GOU99_01705, partial [Candidatus Altiarchaeota archaeon]|nr:hypothetical protein [Candidatus Altiarchaeota archaeon]
MADRKPRKKKTKDVSDFLLGVIERVAQDKELRENQLRSYAGRAFVGIVADNKLQKEQIKTFLGVAVKDKAPAYAIVIEDAKNELWANDVFELSGITYRDLWNQAEPMLEQIALG